MQVCRVAACWGAITWCSFGSCGVQAAQPELGHGVEDSGATAFKAFREWASGYVAEGAVPKPNSVAHGRELAIKRRIALYRLIKSDPASALSVSIPAATRRKLPPVIDEHLEERVSGVGDYAVTCAFPSAGSTASVQVNRYVSLNGHEFEASVYGRRTDQTTKYEIPLHGIAIDGALALSEDVLRRLEAGELPLRNSTEPTDTASTGGVWAEAGGIRLRFDSEAELARKEAQLRSYETGTNPRSARFSDPVLKGEAGASIVDSNFTEQVGDKRVLVVRVDFPDIPGDPRDGLYTASYLQSFADNELNPFFQRSSYGRSAVAFTVTTNLYRMTQPATQYLSVNNELLHQTAMNLAAEDYRLGDFDRFIVVFSSLIGLPDSKVNYAGLAQIGGERIWINGEFTFRVLVHELGHTFGLSHANLWQVKDGNPVSDEGFSLEYADPFDAMGSNFANDRRVDYNPCYKMWLGWLESEHVETVDTPGVYRVFAFDGGVAEHDPLALKLVRGDGRSFWVSYRSAFTDNESLRQGAYVFWAHAFNGSSYLLDLTTPGVEAGDAGLALGRRLIDHLSKISFSVVDAGGAEPRKYIDVRVRFGNAPLVITRQPLNIVAAVGQSFVVEIAADGIPRPHYQWQRQRAEATAWEDVLDGDEAAGCREETLRVKNASLNMNGDLFRCLVSNAEGSLESTAAVLEVRSSGVFLLAGQSGQYGTSDGVSSLARFAYPAGIATDLAGNLYVADAYGCTVRRVAPDGEVTTWAGRPEFKGYKDGPSQNAEFDWPQAVALDAAGILYIADYGNNVLRAISVEGDVTTLAGQPGRPGSDDGVSDTALFRCPWGITVDGEGTIFVSDICDNTIRKITPGGVVTTFAGRPGVRGREDGPGRLARFRDPAGLAVDESGNLYVADLSNSTIRKITPDGVASTIAGVPQTKGNVDGPVQQALFKAPAALAVDHSWNVYVVDRGNHNVRKISPDGFVSTIAGVYDSQAQPAYEIPMRSPAGIALAPGGLYVADTEGMVIWWIVFPPEPPTLRIARSERGVRLSWQSTYGDFVLESAESPGPDSVWVRHEVPVRPSNHGPVIEFPASSATRFFRLRSR